MKINWDVVWSTLRTLLVAGGPIATMLIAFGFPPIKVSEWVGIALGMIGVLSVIVPGLIGAMKQTDAGKAKTFITLDNGGKAAVLAQVPDEIKIAATNNIPGVVVVPENSVPQTQVVTAVPKL